MASRALKICVVGDGGWGTAISLLLMENGHDVSLWSNFPEYALLMRRTRENKKFLPGVKLPDALNIIDSFDGAENYDIFIEAVPTKFLRSVMKKLSPSYPHGRPIVSLTKGIEEKTLMRPTEIIRDSIGDEVSVVAVSGPSHAEEVSRGMPTSVVSASTDHDLAVEVRDILVSDRFRVYASPDLVGVELAGGLKNVIAIAAGAVDGLGFGDNAKSAIFSRGLVELSRLGIALGGRRETFFGLAGVGDLYTTCTSKYGRNRRVGELIGQGRTLDEILSSMEQVAEGVTTASSVHDLAKREGVEMPICEEVYRILFEGKNHKAAVRDLMAREPKPEFW